MFHKDNFRIVVVVERKSRKGEGRREEAQTEAEKVYIYIYIHGDITYSSALASFVVREPSSDFTTDSRAPRRLG